MNDLATMFCKVQERLDGIESDHAVSPTEIWQVISTNPNVVTITYKKEGDNVRAIAVNGDPYKVITIHKEHMVGRLLSEFTVVPKDIIKLFIETVDRDGFMTKTMPLGEQQVMCEMTIMKGKRGRYVEIVKRA